jgi:hypothetical protein
MSISIEGKTLFIDGQPTEMWWPVLDAIEYGDRVFVLLDPDSYLLDPDYKNMRRLGAPPIKNLVALNKAGARLWEADFPETADYYYQLVSASPLIANSFSSYRCEIDPKNGAIRYKEFLK